ncbi:MAG: APC family permease [Acetobacterium sp.]
MENQKKLGLGSAVSVCVGLIVATSCLLLLGQGMGLAGSGFVISLGIVLFLNIMLALTFGELHAIMPNVEGGLGQYTLAGLGPVASIISNLSAYVITMILACSVEMALCGMVINQIFLPMIPAPILSVLLLSILFFVNYNGVDIFAKVQNIVVVLLIGSLVLLGIISFFNLGTGTVITTAAQTAPVVTGISGYVSLAALAFWLFIGIEFVIPLAKDLKNPKRDVTLAMILGIIMLFVVQAMLGVGMTHYVTLEALASSPMPHMLFAENLLGQFGVYWMGIVTLLAGISTANTVLGSVSKILSGMAQDDMMPKVFMKKNKNNIPIAGLVLIFGGVLVTLITGFTQSSGLATILLAGTCFWLTSYILVNISVLILRKKYPDMPGRNKKMTLMGIPQILCIAGDIFMIWNIAEGDARILIYQIFFGLLALLVTYSVVWVKVIKKMPLFKTADVHVLNLKSETESRHPHVIIDPAAV